MIQFPEHLKEKYKVEPPALWRDEDDAFTASLYKDEPKLENDGVRDPALVAWIRGGEVRTYGVSYKVSGIEDQMALMYALFTTGNY